MGVPRGGVWSLVHRELAARQRCVVCRAELLALGVTQRQIERALESGRLYRLHRGVYSLVPAAALPPLAPEQAALLACGVDAVLSHTTAARLHGLGTPFHSRRSVHVTAPHRHRHHGVMSHRARLTPTDHHRVHRLAVTTIARTLADLTPQLSDRALEHLLDEALKRTSRAKLLAAATAQRRSRITRLLDPARPSSDTWSVAEERLLALIRRAGLPAPEANAPIGDYVADLLFRAERVIVEFDSVAHHSGPGAFHADRERHNRLTAAGYTVLHVTWRELSTRPEAVLVWIAQALTRADAP